jgi:hypothetical protein
MTFGVRRSATHPTPSGLRGFAEHGETLRLSRHLLDAERQRTLNSER